MSECGGAYERLIKNINNSGNKYLDEKFISVSRAHPRYGFGEIKKGKIKKRGNSNYRKIGKLASGKFSFVFPDVNVGALRFAIDWKILIWKSFLFASSSSSLYQHESSGKTISRSAFLGPDEM